MSHFALAVITKDKNEIDEILKPYWEDIEVEPYINKTKEDIIKEAKKWKGIFERKERTDFTQEFMNKYLSAKTDEELYQVEKDDNYEYDKDGNQLSTYNPKSKWDWYDIGGRYRNLLLTRKCNNDTFEHNSLAEQLGNFEDNKEAPTGYKWVNGAKIKDIEFKTMEEISDSYEKAIRFWELVVEGQPLKAGEEKPFNLYKKEYFVERYHTKENYAKFESTFSTFALVDENDWYEQGKMGYFGMDNSTKESEEAFIEKFQNYINDPDNQDKYLVIVDCHI